MMKKMYDRVDTYNTFGDDEAMDPAGFIGKTGYQRAKLVLRPISEEEFIALIMKEAGKMRDVMLTIKSIDKDHNGYVTTTELDDILKINFEASLGDRDLKPIIQRFSSIQNRILIDYKGWRQWVLSSLEELKKKRLEEQEKKLAKDAEMSKVEARIKQLQSQLK